MRSLLTFALSFPLLLACDGPAPGTCVFAGKTYRVGDSFPSADGCNTCSCLADGSVACTERACLLLDGGADVVMCTGVTPTFPSFDKRCAAATDCEVALHQINCCGSQKAIGINKAEHDRFRRDEDVCRGQYPGCGCAAQPTVAEDGKTSVTVGDLAVDCKAGACSTYVK